MDENTKTTDPYYRARRARREAARIAKAAPSQEATPVKEPPPGAPPPKEPTWRDKPGML